MMDLLIKEQELSKGGLTAEQAKIEIAVAMFQQQKWSGGKAREFLDFDVDQWQKILFDRKIEPHAGLEGFEKDIETMERFGILEPIA